MPYVLIADDDTNFREMLSMVLSKEGYQVSGVGSGLEAINLVEKGSVDILLLDLKLPDIEGIEVLKRVKRINPNIPILLISGFGTMESVIEAMKVGAYDFLPKPVDIEYVKLEVAKAIQVKGLIAELNTLKEELKPRIQIIGNDPRMQEIFKIIGKVANEKITVLIEGESGTGKELVARAIHAHSNRSEQPFVPVDCSAIPSTLMEGELFGYEKGAFTGAVTRHIGRFEQADKGTIFLDEISNIDLETQAKFLRVIQEEEFQRIGSSKLTKVDVRIICATNKNLEELVSKGLFREDLYHRINVVNIKIPPLRERKGDIPLLVNYFINKFFNQHNGVMKTISKDAMDLLMRYDWPGNVRELENTINQAIVTSQGDVIRGENLNIKHERLALELPTKDESGKVVSLSDIVADLEKRYIKEALKKANNNYTQAARLLGIDRKVLTYKMKKYKLV